jgi:hypothetical protein
MAVREPVGGLGLAPVSRRTPREPLSFRPASGSDGRSALVMLAGFSASRAPLVAARPLGPLGDGMAGSAVVYGSWLTGRAGRLEPRGAPPAPPPPPHL